MNHKRNVEIFLRKGLFEFVFEFLKILKMKLESGPQSMEGQFSDKKGFEPFYAFWYKKGSFLVNF